MSEMVVPDGWEIKRLGDFCQEQSHKFDGRSDVPVLSVTKYDGFVNSLDYFKKQVFSRDLSAYKVVKKGQFAYATIHLDEGSLGLLLTYEKGLISPMYTVFETKGGLDSKYLFFLMKSDLYMTKYPALGQGSINRRMSISFKTLSELKLYYPPLPEQQKIASILTSVDEVIEKTQSQINKLQDLKKGTMNELMTKGIGHTEFKDSPVGKIPKGWEVKKLTEVIEVNHGFQFRDFHFSENGIPVVKIGHLVDGGYVNINKSPSFIPLDLYDDFKSVQLFKNDVLMALTGGTLGKVSIYFSDNVALQNYRVGKFVSKSQKVLHPSLIYWLLQSNYVQKVVEDLVNEAAQPNIGKSDLEIIKIPVPVIEEQKKISSILSSIDKLIGSKQRKLQQTQSLKKSLMQDLLTGKVRVTVN